MRLGKPFFVVIVCVGLRRVDPDCRGQRLGLGATTHETFGMFGVGRLQDFLASLDDLGRFPVVQRRRRQQADAGVIMLVVVPLEEPTTEAKRVFVPTETIGELGPVLHCLELTFGKRIVIGNVWPAM